ncbi:heme peroxidase [Mycena filopes]|nr:heme peroxidase [Mycena filopes]
MATVNAYFWPNPMLDELESLLFEILPGSTGIASFIQPCDTFTFSASTDTGTSGRTNAADWIRTAYHDMATHNKADGTGGLDASIRHPNLTAVPLAVADVLALGAVIAIEKCGGPQIPFRGGRIDATEPNSPGVPQPEETLDSHIAAFSRQGFTQEEMIGLVACGHTFGGVQHAPFPNIVPVLNDPNSVEDVAHFDTTDTHFDNNVATEYISGTTLNPLVVGFNDTTNSDKRIFGSDGNVTMTSCVSSPHLAFANSPELFASTCSALLARMLDTVPNGVQLSDVITPLPVKPGGLTFTLDSGVLQLTGGVRFWNLAANANRVAALHWDDHLGSTHNSTLLSSSESTTTYPNGVATWYSFGPQTDAGQVLALDPAAGIKSMRFVVDGEVMDQGGVGFAVQDGFMFSTTSCFKFYDNNRTARYDIAVRKGTNLTSLYVETESSDPTGHVNVAQTAFFAPTGAAAPKATAYAIWSLNLAGSADTRFVGAEIDGVKYSTALFTPLPALPSCTDSEEDLSRGVPPRPRRVRRSHTGPRAHGA